MFSMASMSSSSDNKISYDASDAGKEESWSGGKHSPADPNVFSTLQLHSLVTSLRWTKYTHAPRNSVSVNDDRIYDRGPMRL